MKINEISMINGKKFIVEDSSGKRVGVFKVYLGDLWNPTERAFIYTTHTLSEMLTFDYYEVLVD